MRRVTGREVSSPQLAGRETEMALLRAALEDAERGRPSVVVLTGDAGVGKSRLVRELEALARTSGTLAMRGECLELSAGELPYAPIAAALRDGDQTVLRPALSRLPAGARHELARVFPDSIPESAARASPDDRFGQSRLFGWILTLLRQISSHAPLLLTIEDFHRADTSSRDFIRFLVQSLRSERLLAIATVRSDELHREHPVRALITELAPRSIVSRVELRPLSEDAIRRQVAAILGSAPPGDLVRRLFRRAEGNPFYTEELLAAAEADDEGLPATLQDALLVRADSLSAPAREALRVVAAAGRPLDEGLIKLALELPERDVEAALRDCIDHNVLVCDRRAGHYGLRHALVGEAVYGDLLPVERGSLHRRIAAALAESPSADNAADRVHHWQLAHEPGLALLASIEAGLAAERVFGYGEALTHFTRAVELWKLEPPDPGSSPLDLVSLLARGAQAARWMGESDRARELCQQALETLDHTADPRRAAQLHERLGRYQPWDTEASLASYRHALRLLPDECAADRMRLYVDEALGLSFLGRWQETSEKAAQALSLAQGDETLATEGSARAVLGIAVAFLGDPAAGERHLRDALELAKRTDSAEDLVQIYLDLGEVLRLEGRIEDALSVMIEGERVAFGVGARPYGDFMAANAADDLFRLGRWEALEERLRELAQRDLDRPTQLLMESVAGRLDTARGRLDQAAERFATAADLCQALDLVEFVPAVYSGYAELDLWRDRPRSARERISEGLGKLGTGENLLHIPALHSMGARVEADVATLARARRDAAEARRACEATEAHHDRLTSLLEASKTTPPEATAHLASCAAELTRALNAPSPPHWERAVSLWQAHSNPYLVAYSAYRHAEALVLSRAPRPQAQTALDSASGLSAGLGAEPLLGDIRALARRARLSSVAPVSDTALTPDPEQAIPYDLTERELEVLRLLGAGLTNREIAAMLIISQHTAGVHVSHILGKLGVANRVMAAAVAERLGLVPRG